MKTKSLLTAALIGAATLSAHAGFNFGFSFTLPVPVMVTAPVVPVVVSPVMVPDGYVWDGYEYVGVVNGQYFYLGAGNVWLACDPYRLERFHGWEGDHRDWRDHAIRNDRFRNDAREHFQPMGHGAPERESAKAAPVKMDHKK